MGDRMNNMNKMMQNPQQRNTYLVGAAIVVLTLGAGFWFASKGSKTPQAQASASVSAVPQVPTAVGTSESPQYNKEVANVNIKKSDEAVKTGGTFVPTITNNNAMSDKSVLDMIEKDNARKKAEAQAKAEEEAASAAKQEQPVAVQLPPQPVVAPVVVQQQPKVQAPRYSTNADYMLIATLSSAWKNKAPSSEYDYARDKTSTDRAVATEASDNSASNATQTQTAQPVPIAKTGTVFNAILETGINSDEPSPVLAKIVSGPLKGTRLIGTINTVGQKVVIQFTTANIPGQPNSVKINAVAVDPNTSRTAMASDVDNHYFKKYGIMFAAAFLSGYANAISHQNTSTIVDPSGGVTVTQGSLTNKQINEQALGSVGTAIANNTQAETQNLKPTITVDGGIAMGILLMDDLIIK